MKKHLVFLLFALFAGMYSANAIEQYREDDTLFVWAKSGLVLRATPDFKAEKIITLPFGAAVKTHSYKYRDEDIAEIKVAVVQPYNFNGQKYPGYKIPGLWVQVTAQGKTGYVFDGYLSKYPPPSELEPDGRGQWHAYLSKVFGIASISKKEGGEDKNSPGHDIVFYKNGASYQRRYVGESASMITYMLPLLSLEEGFLLANYFDDLEKNSNRPVKADDVDDAPFLLVESTPHLLNFKAESSFSGQIKIGYVNGVVVITAFFSC